MVSACKKSTFIIGLLAVMSRAEASILDVPPGEKSVEYINLIMDSIIAPMSAVLNIGCLMFAGLMISYTAITGVMNSAHEGKILGQAQNSMWTPIRVVVALALLIPAPSGYSASQQVITFVAEKGIGLASSVWSASLAYMDNKGTLYAPPGTRHGEYLATAMLRSSVCLEIINHSEGGSVIKREPRMDMGSSDAVLSQHWTGTGISIFNFVTGQTHYPIDACGSMKLTMNMTDDSLILPIKTKYVYEVQKAIADMDDEMYALARSMVTEYRDFQTGDTDSFSFTGKEISLAGKRYDAAIKTALAEATVKLKDARESDTGWKSDAEKWGWMAAGTYYMDIMRLHQSTLDFAAIKPTTSPPVEEVYQNDDYARGITFINDYLKERYTINNEGDTVKITDYKKESTLWDYNKMLKKALEAALVNDDPILSMQTYGHGIINTIETGLIAAGAARIAGSGTANSLYLKIIPGGGAITGAAKALSEMLFTASVVVAAILLPIAFLLAFYLPTMPFILWMMGLAGWFILYIESLIAAPIWAAAHAINSGGDAVSQNAKTGYMLLLSMFLRPTLMLFGFFGSFFVTILMGKLIQVFFIPMVLSVSGDRTIGLVSVISFSIILTMLMITIAHRAFGLIHEIPDRILRYIGGTHETLGEASNEGNNRTMVIGAVGNVTHRAESSLSGGGGKGSTNDQAGANSIRRSQSQHSPA